MHIRLPCLAFALFSILLVEAQDPSTWFNLTLLVSNEVQGQLLPVKSNNLPCNVTAIEATPGDCKGGVARRLTLFKQIRAKEANTITLDCGKFYFGTVLSSFFEGNVSAEVMKRSGYNVTATGTRDYSSGPLVYAKFINATGIRPTVTNVDYSMSVLAGLLTPYHVLSVGGRLVGVISVLLDSILSQTSNAGPSIITNPGGFTPQQLTRLAVRNLKQQHPTCKIIIMVVRSNSDDELTETIKLAQDIEDLDVVLRSPRSTAAGYAWPERYVTSVYGQLVPLVTVRTHKYAGVYKLGFDSDGKVVPGSLSGGTVTLDSTIMRDASLWAYLRPKAEQVEVYEAQVVGTVSNPVSHGDCRTRDCPMGRLFGQAALAGCPQCDFVLYNAGSLNTDFSAGQVTRGDVQRLEVFGNFLVAVTVSGAAVLSMLQHGTDSAVSHGRFPQVAGLKYAYNPKAPRTNRILDIQVKAKGSPTYTFGSTINYERWDLNRNYTVGTNSFLYEGGDGYTQFAQQPVVVAEGPLYQQMVVNALESHSPVVIPTQSELDTCLTAALPIGSYCQIVQSPLSFNLLDVCQGNKQMCLSAPEPLRETILGLPSLANRSECDVCTGLGSCNGISCTCFVPSAGIFKGLNVVRGENCDIIRSKSSINDSYVTIVYVITGLSALVCVVASLVYGAYHEHQIIVSSSPMFLHLINFGGLCLCAAIVLLYQSPSQSICMGQAWLFTIGFILTFGSLALKTYRISKIFNNTNLTSAVRLSNWDLGVRLLAILLVEGFLLMILNIVDPLDTSIVLGNDADWDYFETCHSESSIYFLIILAALNIFVIVFAGYEAYNIRGVHENFNESRFLFTAVQNIAMVGFVVGVILIVTYDSLPETRFLLLGFVFNFLVLSTHGILFASKLAALRIYHLRQVRPKTSMSGTVPSRHYESLKNQFSKMKRERNRFEAQVDDLVAEVRDLKGDPNWNLDKERYELMYAPAHKEESTIGFNAAGTELSIIPSRNERSGTISSEVGPTSSVI